MPERTAKLFKNGSSQAVRLPADFRFGGEEVFIARDEAAGHVMLSSRPITSTWDCFCELVGAANVPANFLADRPMNAITFGGVR